MCWLLLVLSQLLVTSSGCHMGGSCGSAEVVRKQRKNELKKALLVIIIVMSRGGSGGQGGDSGDG